MRILVTGSKGLIGSALKHALHLVNTHVIGIDIRAKKNEAEYGDILDKKKISSIVNQVDGIVHLAAISRVVDGEKDPALCWLTNVQGTNNIVEAALESEKKPWILHASSREVYGQPNELPVHESTVLVPINTYGKSKYAAEKIVQRARENGLVTSIVRFSNVYGSVNDYSDRVIPAFCQAAVKGNNIQVNGKENLFDFTYLEDVIHGILSLIRILAKENSSLPPINLASGKGISLIEIARIAQEMSLQSIQILEGLARPFEVSKFLGDTNRAKEILNWKASVTIEDGIRRLINQYQLLLNIEHPMDQISS